MKRLMLVALLLVSLGGRSIDGPAQSVVSLCDYTPAESRVLDVRLQGSFQWYDGPLTDDRALSMSGSADYGFVYASSTTGRRLDAAVELRGNEAGWPFSARGDGDLKMFWNDDLFALAALGANASEDGLEADLTIGMGVGRFHDVTPLAKAIRVQDALLDLGVLLAPLENEPLLALARIVGEVGPTKEDRTIAAADHLLATGLVRDGVLGVRGLLAMEEILTSAEGGRVCGRDVQARIGLSALLLPELSVATTGVLLYNLALVPDPISQITANASCKLRLARPGELSGDLSAAYTRRMPEGWTARAVYRLTVDRGWSRPGETRVGHVLSASLTTQLFGAIGLSFAGELRHETGDEEISSSLTVHLAYDLF